MAGRNGEGNRSDQFNFTNNVIIDYYNDALIIADWENARVVQWPRRNGQHGQTIISNIQCSGLAMDKDGYLYAYVEYEVRRWKIGEKKGKLVAGGNGEGDHLNQFKYSHHIFVDDNESVYVSDLRNNRVVTWMKDAKEGIIVAGGQGQGNSSTQLYNPEGIIVDRLETVHVVDSGNHRVMRWLKRSKEGEVIVGGNGSGQHRTQLCLPTDLSFDNENNLYVVDTCNVRVQKFSIIEKE